MKIETELKKLDAFYQNMEYQKIEPFLVEKIAEAKEWKRKFGERNWDYLYRVLIALVAIATSGYAIFILFEMR